MGATTRNLIKIEEVIDHDTGDYYIGEIDWRYSGLLEEYIEKYGREGADRLIRALGFMIYTVEGKIQKKLIEEQNAQCCAAGSAGSAN